MKPLKIGITGVRGIVGEALTPEIIVNFAQAFGTYLSGGRVLICRDTRRSGPMVRAAVLSGLLSAGCETVDVGVCPTPSMQIAVRESGAVGGVAITAGHNPEHWNALKFVRADGLYFNAAQAEELLDIYHQGEFAKVRWERIRTHVETADAVSAHVRALENSFDVESVREKKLKVAVDCCNGACSSLIPRWLRALGCEVLAINDDPSATFPHNPEPKPETMAQLRAVVAAGRADVGFAYDADGERLGVVTDEGRPLSEELTVVLAASIKLGQQPGPIVTNVSTTAALDALAERYGQSVIRTPVGQTYVSEAILEHGAVIGGEGSGGVALPQIQATHDSAAATTLILEALAASGEPISALARALPQLTMIKHNVAVEPSRLYSVLHALRDEMEKSPADEFDVTDGLKIRWPDASVHVRASNTESMIRIIVEAREAQRARDLLSWTRDKLRK